MFSIGINSSWWCNRKQYIALVSLLLLFLCNRKSAHLGGQNRIYKVFCVIIKTVTLRTMFVIFIETVKKRRNVAKQKIIVVSSFNTIFDSTKLNKSVYYFLFCSMYISKVFENTKYSAVLVYSF
jgi:hypothetical protein